MFIQAYLRESGNRKASSHLSTCWKIWATPSTVTWFPLSHAAEVTGEDALSPAVAQKLGRHMNEHIREDHLKLKDKLNLAHLFMSLGYTITSLLSGDEINEGTPKFTKQENDGKHNTDQNWNI